MPSCLCFFCPCGTFNKTMKSAQKTCLFLLFIALCFTLMSAQIASAATFQSITVRGGEHKTYSRIVMDWPQSVEYTVQEISPGTYSISFSVAAELSLQKLNVGILSRIKMLSEKSTNPLRVEVQLADGYAIKDFRLGNKIVFDTKKQTQSQIKKAVTAPKLAAPVSPLEKLAHPKQEAQAPMPDPVTLEQPIVQEKPATTDQKKNDKTVVKSVDNNAKILDVNEASSIVKSINPKEVVPNLLTISSVSSNNMAAFLLNDRVWVINDNKKSLLSPKISGPQKDDIGPLDQSQNDQAKIFKINHLRNAHYQAQGGGLAWRLVISKQKPEPYNPILPIREAMSSPLQRGGSVIFPFKSAQNVIDLIDPMTGFPVKVITVEESIDYSVDEKIEFFDFTVLPSPLGLAILSKVDDLDVRITSRGVQVYRQSGLVLTPQTDYDLALATRRASQTNEKEKAQEKTKISHEQYPTDIYEFWNWEQGPIDELPAFTTSIMSSIGGLSTNGQVESLLSLAQAYIAHGMGYEALGYLDIALDTLPDLDQSPAFKAIKGVALALSNRPEEAFEILSTDKDLKDKEDVRLWRSLALAHLQDWQQAEDLLPEQMERIALYPDHLAIPLVLSLGEVSLRAGDTKRSQALLNMAYKLEDKMRLPSKATLTYLKGEKARQAGDFRRAERYWEKARTMGDDLYWVKSALALTQLKKQQDKITNAEIIDRLERVRYAWRGDDLEANVNYWLGRAYFDNENFVKGLNIMRDAAGFANGPHLGQRITADMTEEFHNIYLGENLNQLSAPEAGALYERFAELIPQDERGDLIGRKLADHLIQSHLFDKASEILTDQLENRATGKLAYEIAMDLAKLEQKRRRYDKSLEYLNKAQQTINQTPELQNDQQNQTDIVMYRSNALSYTDKSDEALELLFQQKPETNVNLLRVDIAWRHGNWDDAAEALQYLLDEMDTHPDQELNETQSDYLLRRAIALNLGGDRIRLANLRESYGETMKQTKKAKAFEIVTRPRQTAILTDRDTLLSIVSETDLFTGFFDDEESAE